MLLELTEVSKDYALPNGGPPVSVLKNVALQLAAGEALAIIGPSGSGKSTLLNIMGALDHPSAGQVRLDGRELSSLSELELATVRNRSIGFVFQLHNLIPDLTLEENCLIPTVAAGTPRREALARLHDLAGRTGLTHRLTQRIQKLSGGERQRTALCRALMNGPGILLADEPTGSLDERTSRQIFDLLLDLARTDGITLVMATHDRGLAAQCDRLVEMRDGKICE